MKQKRIIISVTNDLVRDNRVHKVALSLLNKGFDILIVGRKLKNSLSITGRKYKTKRFRLFFNKSALFYAEYNLRLFLFLLFCRADIFLSNDLDSLPANFFASRIRKKKLVFDSHELFSQVPELIERPKTQKIWISLEKFFLPKLKYSYTVCDSIARYYHKEYAIDMKVVRNMPICGDTKITEKEEKNSNRKILLYQGSVNIGRGLESIIEAMRFLEGFVLWIVGDGDILGDLKTKVKAKKLEQKVQFFGQVKFQDLWQYTRQADLGFSVEENLGLNYFYALPNKIFDYIQAEIPILCSDFPEMKNIIRKYDIGTVLKSRKPEKIAMQIKSIFTNKKQLIRWKENLQEAKKELCWQNEEKTLLPIFTDTE